MSSRSSQPKRASSCMHVISVGSNSWEDVYRKKASQEVCESCCVTGPNLWLCLHSQCLYIGCGESSLDHSSTHAKLRSGHCLTLNLTTMRIWCYVCESEVFRDNNSPSFVMREKIQGPSSNNDVRSSPTSSVSAGALSEDSESDEEEENERPRGLTGLQNIGNTCYLNAAVQSLSNCPPLTRFFLDCGGCVRTDKKPMLCRNYMRLMQEMWHKKRPSYVIPSGVVHGIKQVHPMFRGFAQQDSQEFLRCFMDQIHEELKQTVVSDEEDEEDDHMTTSHDIPESNIKEEPTALVMETSATSTPTSVTTNTTTQIASEVHSQSDTDYETCDSGMSSERSSVEQNMSGDEASEIHRCNSEDSKVQKRKKYRLRLCVDTTA